MTSKSESRQERLEAAMAEIRDLICDEENIFRVQELAKEGLEIDSIDGIWQKINRAAKQEDWNTLATLTRNFNGKKYPWKAKREA